MTIKRIEVCRSKDTADLRAEWMRQRGFTIDTFESAAEVVLDARDFNGSPADLLDNDNEVWLIIGTKN